MLPNKNKVAAKKRKSLEFTGSKYALLLKFLGVHGQVPPNILFNNMNILYDKALQG